MVQGPNDLIPPPTTPPNPPQNGEVVRQKRQTPPTAPAQTIPLQQDADTVQLSRNAVQAAAYARAGGVQAPVQAAELRQNQPQALPLQPAAGPRINANVAGPLAPPTGRAPAVPPAPTVATGAPAGAPSTLVQEKISPVQALASAFAATPSRTAFQSEPEVRPDRVREALDALASTNGNNGAVNAQVAEKLLTEF